jgi:hypothetical protein
VKSRHRILVIHAPLTVRALAWGGRLVDRVASEFAGHHGRVIVVIDDLHELNSPEALGRQGGVDADVTVEADLNLVGAVVNLLKRRTPAVSLR